MAFVVDDAINAAANIGNVINNVVDANKRRNYEMALANLNASETIKLNQQLATAKKQTDREAILANALTSVQAAKVQQETELLTQRNKLITIAIIAGSIMLIGLTAIIVIKKKNS